MNTNGDAMFTQDYNSGPSFIGFKAFVDGKDPDEHYNWMCAAICACGQYGKSIGINDWQFHMDENDSFWKEANTVARGQSNAAYTHDWTFGELSERLKGMV